MAAWFSGLLDPLFAPPLAVVAPYTLTAERAADGSGSLTGYAPDEAGQALLLESFGAAAGTPAPAEAIALAAGAPVEGWSTAAAALIADAAALDAWRVELSDRDAGLGGIAPDRATRDRVAAAFAETARGAGLTPDVQVGVGPVQLSAEAVGALLAPLADCGPLAPHGPPEGDFPLGATVAVTGNVAERATIDAIRGALEPAIGDRALRADLAVLNPELCAVLRLMTASRSGPISIALGHGDREGPNLSGIYAIGDNPVIDVLVPADLAQGYLWVAIADVTGNLFNILPNIARPESALAALGEPGEGVRRVRVAYSEAEAAEEPGRLAFAIDDTFGKSLVIVFHTDRPLFEELRPTTESVAAFAEALDKVLQAGSVEILSIATQFINSRQ